MNVKLFSSVGGNECEADFGGEVKRMKNGFGVEMKVPLYLFSKALKELVWSIFTTPKMDFNIIYP